MPETEATTSTVTNTVVGAYDRLVARRDEREAATADVALVIQAENAERELSRQGWVKWYLNTYEQSAACPGWLVFVRDLFDHNANHTHQGGIFLFITEGEGYSVVDGERFDWRAGDVVLLPIRNGGVEHQHFATTADGRAAFLGTYYMPFWEELAGKYEQNSVDPRWRAEGGADDM